MRWLALFGLLPIPALADAALECSLDLGTQVEIADCVAGVEERAQRAMELELGFAREAAGELDDTTGRAVALPALETAQAAWESYRDTQCAFVGATYGGGSGAGIAERSCRIGLTRARMGELAQHLR
ncbi:lysozyme inhibitor LprI family protein [Celeribacter indicus]|uniref:Lysozyme inhibitor LprI-like N-terminal domain-containing protein n=1 Tax=Celeribacter indicus TaxID=1208324 RepID=A0A0B5E4M3_9RHOB|nr:lysozyme inhibitor LprI family protein [Celeribacter indicus]AJE47322.1 hypothetical protein P73_2607 [Celeribacter indicus]SDW03443.1 Protein of unknown function [Celeribacter indicus]